MENETNRTAPSGQPGTVLLRPVTFDDLPLLFEQQRDPDANYMAAFTAANPDDWDAFAARWTRLLGDNTTLSTRAILFDGALAGSMLHFPMEGVPHVGYWLGKQYWGKGIATRALTAFVQLLPQRPLYARTAHDNHASQRVLQHCGFTITGTDHGYANARGAEIEEVIFTLR